MLAIFFACTEPGTLLAGASPDGDTGAGSASGLDNSALVSATFPESVGCGEAANATVEMQNAGDLPWTYSDGYKLGAVDDDDPFYRSDTRVWIPDGTEIPPGESYTFTIPMVGPANAGLYTTDWRMVKEGVYWFGETETADVTVSCAGPTPRSGAVRLENGVLTDDTGNFNALGATLFWAAWGYRNDRAKLERNLASLQSEGFDYFRALGVVGDPVNADSWDGLEIEYGWDDYEDVIAGLTDLAFDSYGLRVEWTLIGDGQLSVPSTSEKYALADRFLEMSVGREEKIMHFEVANEYWQNGFDGDDGLAELRDLTEYLNRRTDILVASSAPAGHDCASIDAVYSGGLADVATIHFDRDTSTIEGGWRPVRQPWDLADCADVPTGSNNEPIGPGSSVASEDNPDVLAAAAVATWVSGLPFYVFHSSAGVRGVDDISAMSGYDSFAHLRDLVPPDLAAWQRVEATDASGPFVAYAVDSSGNAYADSMWTDLASPAAGADRMYTRISGTEFFTFPFGIIGDLSLVARRDLDYTLYDPVSGATTESGSRSAGETLTIVGASAVIIRGNVR